MHDVLRRVPLLRPALESSLLGCPSMLLGILASPRFCSSLLVPDLMCVFYSRLLHVLLFFSLLCSFLLCSALFLSSLFLLLRLVSSVLGLFEYCHVYVFGCIASSFPSCDLTWTSSFC